MKVKMFFFFFYNSKQTADQQPKHTSMKEIAVFYSLTIWLDHEQQPNDLKKVEMFS